MKFIKTMNEFRNRVDETTEEMGPDAEKQVILVGAGVVVYIAASLSYFAVKGGKLALKALQNRQ